MWRCWRSPLAGPRDATASARRPGLRFAAPSWDRAHEVIALERSLTDRFTADEHQQLCQLLDSAIPTLLEQTPTPHTS